MAPMPFSFMMRMALSRRAWRSSADMSGTSAIMGFRCESHSRVVFGLFLLFRVSACREAAVMLSIERTKSLLFMFPYLWTDWLKHGHFGKIPDAPFKGVALVKE